MTSHRLRKERTEPGRKVHEHWRLERWQGRLAWVAGICLALGFLASIDILLLPRGNPAVAWLLHPLLFAAGIAGGIATHARGIEIDRKRWAIVDDPLLTSGEREYAHKDAERRRRVAGTVFLVAPLVVGYWMAYQFSLPGGGNLAASLLGATPLPGFGLGLILGGRIFKAPEPKL